MLKIHEFLSIATGLAFNAAEIIQATYLSADIGQKMKGVDDPVTLADLKAQTHIIKVLNQRWPDLRIIGEEETQCQVDMPLKSWNLIYPEQIFSLAQNGENVKSEYDVKDLCVWVDPLDGTLSFVKNELDAVTTLIGLTHKGRPIAGVIGQPYKKINDTFEYKPVVYFGHTAQQRIFYTYDESPIPFELIKQKLDIERMCFSLSLNRVSEDKINKIASISKQQIRCGGSGRKCLSVLLGESDFFIYIGDKMARWDTCAGEALIEAFSGRLTDLQGQNYAYLHENKDFMNPFGTLASLHDVNLYKQVIEKTKHFM